MNVAIQKSWTVEEFLAWEERQEIRYEFDGFQPVAITGGTFAHDAIQVNLVTSLSNRLRGKPCRVHGNSLKIHAMGSIRYPDAFVTCSPIQRNATVAYEPVVIFEVLSTRTRRTDYLVKNREYAGTASILHYIMLEQVAIEGMMFTRTADAADWIGHILGPEAVLQIPEIGIELPLAELYAGLDPSSPQLDD